MSNFVRMYEALRQLSISREKCLDYDKMKMSLLPSASKSDLDIGIKPEKPLSVQEKVKIAIFLEDLFDVPRVDVVEIPRAPVSLALEIVQGERLYARDDEERSDNEIASPRLAMTQCHDARHADGTTIFAFTLVSRLQEICVHRLDEMEALLKRLLEWVKKDALR